MDKIKIRLKRSLIGRSFSQKEALRCLGLRKIHQEKEVLDHSAIWGQLRKVFHLVEYRKIKAEKNIKEHSEQDVLKSKIEIKKIDKKTEGELKKKIEKKVSKEIRKKIKKKSLKKVDEKIPYSRPSKSLSKTGSFSRKQKTSRGKK